MKRRIIRVRLVSPQMKFGVSLAASSRGNPKTAQSTVASKRQRSEGWQIGCIFMESSPTVATQVIGSTAEDSMHVEGWLKTGTGPVSPLRQSIWHLDLLPSTTIEYPAHRLSCIFAGFRASCSESTGSSSMNPISLCIDLSAFSKFQQAGSRSFGVPCSSRNGFSGPNFSRS